MKVLEMEIKDSDTHEDAESVKELNEVQLALVGGGCGEVVFH